MPFNPSAKTSEKACSTSHTVAANNIHTRVTTVDALNYLLLVKDAFRGEPAKYETFLDIMKEFRSHRIDTPTVATRVKDLFSGHPELIQGFNFFLPTGYQIPIYVREDVAHYADRGN